MHSSFIGNNVIILVNLMTTSVVYFDQHLGAAHFKHWLKSQFLTFFMPKKYITSSSCWAFVYVSLCCAFFLFFPIVTEKMLNSEKDDFDDHHFDQQTACEEPSRWLKYTTSNSRMAPIQISYTIADKFYFKKSRIVLCVWSWGDTPPPLPCPTFCFPSNPSSPFSCSMTRKDFDMVWHCEKSKQWFALFEWNVLWKLK